MPLLFKTTAPDRYRCSTVILFTASLIFLTLLYSCGNKKNDAGSAAGKPGGRPNMVAADVYVVQLRAFQNNFTASGNLLPNEEVSLMPEVSGRVTNIFFSEGSFVKKGQTLIQLNDADVRADIRKLQAQHGLQAALQNRQKELLDIGGISRQDYEATRTNIAAIDADIAATNAQLAKTRLVAPFSGRIGLRNISVGAVITPTTVIAILQQTNPLKLDFAVPDQYRDAIRAKQEVFFTVEEQDYKRTGTIAAIEPGADVNTRNIRVRATVPNPDNSLAPGSFARVNLPLNAESGAIVIPSQSIIPSTRDKKVAVVRDGKAKMAVVETGTRSSAGVLITSGLRAGDTILTTGIMQVKEGMTVKVRKVTK